MITSEKAVQRKNYAARKAHLCFTADCLRDKQVLLATCLNANQYDYEKLRRSVAAPAAAFFAGLVIGRKRSSARLAVAGFSFASSVTQLIASTMSATDSARDSSSKPQRTHTDSG